VAIIYLQKFVGIVEDKAHAKEGWDAMTEDEKENTLTAYRAIGGRKLD
jgi:hypothetical protein